MMKQELPPWTLVKAWLDILQKDIPQAVKDKRLKVLIYYFGSIQSAISYVEENDDFRQVS